MKGIAKPDLDFCDDEEALMDDILGSTGLAFQKSGLVRVVCVSGGWKGRIDEN